MKFGATLKHLEIPEWEDKYVSYNTIKKLLKASTDSKQKAVFGETEEEEFVTQLDSELEKVQAFHSQQMEEIRQSIDKCATQIDAIDRLDESSKEHSELDTYAEQVNRLADWINKLSNYAQVNYTAVIKLVKKHDRHVSYRVRPLFLIRLKQCSFWKQDYEPLLLQLSELFRVIRSEITPIGILSTSMPQQRATEQFLRKSTKYLVTLDNVLELKTFILRHLPMLVYDNTQRSNKPINPPITSIYLDNSDLELYNAKVDKEDGAQVIRLRWYGSTKDTNKIYVERKIQQEEDKGELKDRFMLKEKYIKDYLDGSKDGIQKAANKIRSKHSSSAQREAEAFEDLASELQDVIKSKYLQPVHRTYYTRTAFQIPGDSRFRLSLDTNLTLIREDDHLFPDDDTTRRPNGTWRRPDVDVNFPFTNIASEDIRRFPYAILEIKLNLPAGAKTPLWIDDLIASGLVEEAPKFSKFVHATAILFERRVQLLPFWLAQMDTEEDDVPPSHQSTDVINVLSRKYSNLSKDIGVQSPGDTTKSQPFGRADYFNQENDKSNIHNIPSTKPASTSPLMPANHANFSISKAICSTFNALTAKISTCDQTPQHTGEPVILPPGVRIPKTIQTAVRVEPKVFFANERTFFSWMSFAVLLGSFSIALVNSGDRIGKICGLMYTMVSLSTMIYGCGLYYRRYELIMARASSPYGKYGLFRCNTRLMTSD
ncbi:hypothetical protein NQZ79_g4698 [Umbelopsis isabellina]|nr:hypothetical protein NQZ79_g4698 [Umbelopsis isabellina]